MRKRSRGAVTVLVTLLLIPAVLVSGSGVDLARIYAARGMVRDANQLAANSVLTEYDATLQDLYGLYAVVKDDEALTSMVDTYVRASLFGEKVTEAKLNEFRLFGGQESVTCTASGSAPLSNLDILRRQIEEYAKYRVPVAIVKEIIERFDTSEAKEMAANNEAVARKIAVDEEFEKALLLFNEVIEKADELADQFDAKEEAAYKEIDQLFAQIQYEFQHMASTRRDYAGETNDDRKEDHYKHYMAISDNICALVSGGVVGHDWVEGDYDENGDWVPGRWGNPEALNTVGLQAIIGLRASELEEFTEKLNELNELCQQADAAKEGLAQKISELKAKLSEGTCSEELAKGMEEEIKDAEKLLGYNFTELGAQMKSKAEVYITGSAETLRQIQGYGQPDLYYISFENLSSGLSLHAGFLIELSDSDDSDQLHIVQNVASVYLPGGSFPRFETISEAHRQCYEIIKGDLHIKSESELSSQEKESRNGLISAYKEILKGLVDYQPAPGADSYPGAAGSSWAFSTQGSGMELDFGLSDLSTDSSLGGIAGTLKTLTGLVTGETPVKYFFERVLTNVSNRVLLVGYSTQMFSNWTTKVTGQPEKSLTGSQISASNNYFLNSELEYLVNGSPSAKTNLAKVSITILVLRFMADYVSSYMIESVSAEITIYEGLVSMIPYVGGVLQFLVRPLFVLGQSMVDVALLRSGHAVPLVLMEDDDWKFSITGFSMDAATRAEGSEEESGLFYADYLTAFLLTSDPNVLASRIADLIALNVTTRKQKIAENAADTKGTDERADAMEGVSLFDLSRAWTTFEINTETQVRFVFLSMPFAQKGINGVVPSTTFPVRVVTYRGY